MHDKEILQCFSQEVLRKLLRDPLAAVRIGNQYRVYTISDSFQCSDEPFDEGCHRNPGTTLAAGVKMPPIRGLMDDMTVACKTVVEAHWTVENLNKIITWARMKFKAPKSCSLVVKQGKVTNRYRFKINDEAIPSLSENPVKALGKWYRPELNDQQSIKKARAQLESWLSATNKNSLPGRYKMWIYQHGILPRIL